MGEMGRKNPFVGSSPSYVYPLWIGLIPSLLRLCHIKYVNSLPSIQLNNNFQISLTHPTSAHTENYTTRVNRTGLP